LRGGICREIELRGSQPAGAAETFHKNGRKTRRRDRERWRNRESNRNKSCRSGIRQMIKMEEKNGIHTKNDEERGAKGRIHRLYKRTREHETHLNETMRQQDILSLTKAKSEFKKLIVAHLVTKFTAS
jgi:hypothetical protein